jgi:hypothetical protein
MDTELSLRTQIDEIREEYAITELTRSMKLLTVDYIQQEIAKMAALGFHYVELSDEPWLYGKEHLESEWKRPLKEFGDQSLYERLQLAMPYKNCIFYVSYETRIIARWGRFARLCRHFEERTPHYPCFIGLVLFVVVILFILECVGVFDHRPWLNVSRS